ncbi:unnamed protein product [Closterium sp. NIES-54]
MYSLASCTAHMPAPSSPTPFRHPPLYHSFWHNGVDQHHLKLRLPPHPTPPHPTPPHPSQPFLTSFSPPTRLSPPCSPSPIPAPRAPTPQYNSISLGLSLAAATAPPPTLSCSRPSSPLFSLVLLPSLTPTPLPLTPQYNSISLGLSLGGATAVMSRHYLLGSVLFSLAINHKHMALYFAPAFFAHLLGRCRQSPRPALMFLSLAATVLLSFAACWWPFLHSTDSILQVLSRLFPLGRGLYEDHVANFWCATSPLIKWKRLFSTPLLARMALAATVTAALPSMLHQVLRPSAHGLVLAMLNSSLAFFFFAFQGTACLHTLPACTLCLPAHSATYMPSVFY